MKMPERFLLGNHLDVKLLCVGNEGAHVARRHRAAGRRDERVVGVAEALLEVW